MGDVGFMFMDDGLHSVPIVLGSADRARVIDKNGIHVLIIIRYGTQESLYKDLFLLYVSD